MRKDRQFIDKIIETFPDRLTNECLSISQKDIDFIQDNEENQRCYFTGDTIEGFKIVNPNKKEINLFSVDGCFFSSDESKRCDGIIFDDKELCFFELKLNIVSKKGNKKRERFNSAIEQLETTIAFLINNKVGFCNLTPQAYICMFDNYYPSDNASIKRKKIAFLEKNNIPLFDKNIKQFK